MRWTEKKEENEKKKVIFQKGYWIDFVIAQHIKTNEKKLGIA